MLIAYDVSLFRASDPNPNRRRSLSHKTAFKTDSRKFIKVLDAGREITSANEIVSHLGMPDFTLGSKNLGFLQGGHWDEVSPDRGAISGLTSALVGGVSEYLGHLAAGWRRNLSLRI